jgi:hypothetical protein
MLVNRTFFIVLNYEIFEVFLTQSGPLILFKLEDALLSMLSISNKVKILCTISTLLDLSNFYSLSPF